MKTQHQFPKPKRSATEWAALVAASAKTELSVDEFCDQHNITLISLRNWTARLKHAVKANSRNAFTPVRIASPEITSTKPTPPAAPGRVEIVLNNGRVVRIYGTVVPTQVVAVLAIAEGSTAC
jgi:hypothetical protein